MKRLSKDNVIYNFENGMKESYKVESGEVVIVETCDCFHEQITKEEQILLEIDMDIINPATGPIYIESAEPGDILKVEIIDIIVKDKGVAATIPNEGGLSEEAKDADIEIIDIEDGYAKYLNKSIPIKPMIGVIGVAPAKEDVKWGTHTPWKHGGNMDSKVITKGTNLYFQVNQKGAMLSLGDLHGVMGDGELCFTGLEISGEVELKATVIKGKRNINWPIVETENRIEIIGSGENLEKAMKAAASDGVRYIQEALGSSWAESYIMGSLVLDLRISQVVNPMKTVRASIPKYILTMDDILK